MKELKTRNLRGRARGVEIEIADETTSFVWVVDDGERGDGVSEIVRDDVRGKPIDVLGD
jgi:hypothetical protein